MTQNARKTRKTPHNIRGMIMQLLTTGEQFANSYDFGRRTLKFEGWAGERAYYRHADYPVDGPLITKIKGLWYDSGYTDITELRNNVSL